MADKKIYSVIAPLVIARTPEGDRYLYAGAPVPEDLADDEVKRLVEGGFIAEPKKAEPAKVAAPKVDEPVVLPEGDPNAEWTVKQLKAYAGTLTIDLGEAKNKDDILAVIVAAK